MKKMAGYIFGRGGDAVGRRNVFDKKTLLGRDVG